MKYVYYEDSEEEASVNLTPLIDIVFVILMAFMIAVPLLRLDAIALAVGSSNKPVLEKEQLSSIVIKVFIDKSITLNDQTVSLQELKTQLTLLHQQYPQETPLLLQDGDIPFRYYQDIKSTVEASGFHELHIALQPT